TMEIHHDRHHVAYINNLNGIAKDNPQIAQKPAQDVLAKLSELPEAIRTPVRNNMGGHANHTMFCQIMGPRRTKPAARAAAAIDRARGGREKCRSSFKPAGGSVCRSGGCFVVDGREGKLELETLPNRDSPLMDGKRVLMGKDVWEQAYYFPYQSRRPDYLKAW